MKEDVKVAYSEPRAKIVSDFREHETFDSSDFQSLFKKLYIDEALVNKAIKEEANQLDEGLLVVQKYSTQDDPELEAISSRIFEKYKSLVNNPHSTTFSSLIDEVKRLNELGLQCEQAVRNFKTSISTRKLILSIQGEDLNKEQILTKLNSKFDEIEKTALEKVSAYHSQIEVVKEKCASAISSVELAEAFRSENYQLLKNNKKWAEMHDRLMTKTTPSASRSSCIDEANVLCVSERFFLRRLKQLEKSIPKSNILTDELSSLSKTKTRQLTIYRSNPEFLDNKSYFR